MNRSDLINLSNTSIADSPPGNITAAELRTINNEVINSCASITDPNTFTNPTTFNGVTRFENVIDTTYEGPISPQSTVDLGAVVGNFVIIAGSFDYINSFGTAPAGAWRHLIFNDPCVITTSPDIDCPGNAQIDVASGDRCTVVSKGGGAWVVQIYLRADGTSLVSPNFKRFYYSINQPTSSDNSSTGFLRGFRWMSYQSPLYREWILDEASSGLWNQMSGVIGTNSKPGDLDFVDVVSSFTNSGVAPTVVDFNVLYQRRNQHLVLTGWVEATHTNGQPGLWLWTFNPTSQGINITTGFQRGVALLVVNNQPVGMNEYTVEWNGIRLWVTNCNFPNDSTLRLYFHTTFDFTV